MAPQRPEQAATRRQSRTPRASRNRISEPSSVSQAGLNGGPSMTPIRRFQNHRRAGSLSAEGLFQGLNRQQAMDSMELIQHEFTRFMAAQDKGKGPAGSNSTDIDVEEHDTCDDVDNANSKEDANAMEASGDETDTVVAGRQGGRKGKWTEEERYDHLALFWGNRRWGRFFSLYKEFDQSNSKSPVPVSKWNRFVTWFWNTLTQEHMSDQQDLLQRIRTHKSYAPKVDSTKYLPGARLELEQNVLRDYQRMLRSMNSENLSRIAQRFTMASLYNSHTAYVRHLRLKNISPQTASKTVNQILATYFSEQQGKPISIQIVKNQVQQGRHWHELMFSTESKHLGLGLVVLLPTEKFSNIAETATDNLWTFVCQQIPKLPQRVLDLALAMQPIGEAIQVEGLGNVSVPLLGYELREAVSLNITDLERDKFNACLTTYPTLDIKAAFCTIKASKRTANPDRIQDLVRKEWEAKNKRDGDAFLDRADQIERSAVRETIMLRRHGRDRLSKVASEGSASDTESSDDSFVPSSDDGSSVGESGNESNADQDDHSQESQEIQSSDGNESSSEDSSASTHDNPHISPSRAKISTEVKYIFLPSHTYFPSITNTIDIQKPNAKDKEVEIESARIATHQQPPSSPIVTRGNNKPGSSRSRRGSTVVDPLHSTRNPGSRIGKAGHAQSKPNTERIVNLPPQAISEMFNEQSSTRNMATDPGTMPTPSTSQIPEIIDNINIPQHEQTCSSNSTRLESRSPKPNPVSIAQSPCQTELDSEDERILALYDEEPTVNTSRALIVYKPSQHLDQTTTLSEDHPQHAPDDIILPDIIEVPRSPSHSATSIASSPLVAASSNPVPLMIAATPYGSPPPAAPVGSDGRTQVTEVDAIYQELVGILDSLPQESAGEGDAGNDGIL